MTKPPDVDVDVVVVGAGVVGCAVAAEVVRSGRSVFVLERGDGPGRETSSRNSGVVHAGIYYPPGSLKAETCVEGKRLLYERCRRHDIPHRNTGKLVLATQESEIPKLETVRQRAQANGVEGMTDWDRATLRRREPHLRAVAALHSASSGVVDAHGLCESYIADARTGQAELVFRTHVTGLDLDGGGAWTVSTRGPDGDAFAVRARNVVNAAGLVADRVASMAGIDIDAKGWRLAFAKGDYFSFASSAPRTEIALVYPVPVEAGLGVHITTDLSGRRMAGPDVTWVDEPAYDVDPAKAPAFAEAVRRYLPDLRDDQLSADYAGVRPKLQRPGEPPRDFVIEECSDLGAPGLVCMMGIESPGLTASEALARRVVPLLG